jgi:hypothetical protein
MADNGRNASYPGDADKLSALGYQVWRLPVSYGNVHEKIRIRKSGSRQ